MLRDGQTPAVAQISKRAAPKKEALLRVAASRLILIDIPIDIFSCLDPGDTPPSPPPRVWQKSNDFARDIVFFDFLGVHFFDIVFVFTFWSHLVLFGFIWTLFDLIWSYLILFCFHVDLT